MELLATASETTSRLFLELGLAVIFLAALARIASRFGFSAIPLYLLAGLGFGAGGAVQMPFSEEFVRIGAEVGVVLLLFMLGLEYTGEKLIDTMKTGLGSGILDLVFNSAPGVAVGLIMGMSPLASALLGGLTYISSSGIVAKILGDMGAASSPDAGLVIRILVLEDLAMAAYLPVIAVLLTGESLTDATVSVAIALLTVATILFLAVRFGRGLSRFVANQTDEVVLLSTLGVILVVSGLASSLNVSAAVGAFLVGVAVSGTLADRAEKQMAPLRDLFAATFFLFFGMQIDPATLPPVLPVAFVLAILSAATKVATGWLAARAEGESAALGIRAGITLIPRGEFSIVIAGLGTAIEPRLGPLAAAYVLILAVIGPLLARLWGVTARGPRHAKTGVGSPLD